VKNVAASVRDRLANQARATGVPFAALMERFALGRLLWRLSRSEAADRFILKGAQLFSLWAGTPHRPTRDLDLLGSGDSSPESLKTFFTDLLAKSADPEDGLVWGTVEAGQIREDQRYEGVRVTTKATLAGALVPVQVDIGFGDAITPEAVQIEWKELLDFPEARLLAYPPETVIAEKLEAVVTLGMANSRMKDFFDLDWLARNRKFEADTLRRAVQATFERRGTELPVEMPVALTAEFGGNAAKITQWNAFLKKSRLEGEALGSVTSRLASFLGPIVFSGNAVTFWKPSAGWSTAKP